MKLPRRPITFRPRFQQYLWGGRNLETLLGRDLPEGIVAESWEISAHPAAPTEVDSGELAGRDLPWLVEEFGVALIGHRGDWAVERGLFPLLIKLLDANRPLSVQVHPDDAYGAEHEGGELGKTEMWYVLHARPKAEIIYGLGAGVDADGLRAALETGDVERCLHRVSVEAGQAVLIPAGTVHAILDGIVLAEVQQSSNATYRVFDWNRTDEHGNARELHIDKALDVIDFDHPEPSLTPPRPVPSEGEVKRAVVAESDKFVVERVRLPEGSAFEGRLDGETLEIWGVLEGTADITALDGGQTLNAVRFALLPAQMGQYHVRAVDGDVVALRAYLP